MASPGGAADGAFASRALSEDEQRRIQETLEQGLQGDQIRSRLGPGGKKVDYVMAGEQIAMANNIFGFNGWSCRVTQLQTDVHRFDQGSSMYKIGVSAVVRVTLKDGSYHEDLGYGEAIMRSETQAMDKAKKQAVTDARKRALRLFGEALGNSINNKEKIEAIRKEAAGSAAAGAARLYHQQGGRGGGGGGRGGTGSDGQAGPQGNVAVPRHRPPTAFVPGPQHAPTMRAAPVPVVAVGAAAAPPKAAVTAVPAPPAKSAAPVASAPGTGAGPAATSSGTPPTAAPEQQPAQLQQSTRQSPPVLQVQQQQQAGRPLQGRENQQHPQQHQYQPSPPQQQQQQLDFSRQQQQQQHRQYHPQQLQQPQQHHHHQQQRAPPIEQGASVAGYNYQTAAAMFGPAGPGTPAKGTAQPQPASSIGPASPASGQDEFGWPEGLDFPTETGAGSDGNPAKRQRQ
ncbi:unnamed protein product [Phaeothamnion confervicola]